MVGLGASWTISGVSWPLKREKLHHGYISFVSLFGALFDQNKCSSTKVTEAVVRRLSVVSRSKRAPRKSQFQRIGVPLYVHKALRVFYGPPTCFCTMIVMSATGDRPSRIMGPAIFLRKRWRLLASAIKRRVRDRASVEFYLSGFNVF